MRGKGEKERNRLKRDGDYHYKERKVGECWGRERERERHTHTHTHTEREK